MAITWGKENLSAEELEELYKLQESDPDMALLRVFAVCMVGIIVGLLVWAVTQ